MPDVAIVNSTVGASPKDYVLTGSQELLMKAVEASIDGSGTTSSYQAVLQMLAPDGTVMWSAPTTTTVAAGESVVVSWFPDVIGAGSGSSGGGLTVSDGTTSVSGAGAIDFTSGATVTDGGGGVADVSISGGMSKLFDQTLSLAAASIDTGANGVPSGYSALQISITARADGAFFSGGFQLQFNNDTAANYDYIWTNNSNGVSSSFISTGITSGKVMEGPGASIGAGIYGVAHVTVPAYAQTTAEKAFTSLGGFAETSGHSELVHSVSNWRNTAAITRVALITGIGNLVAGSRMTIYGLP